MVILLAAIESKLRRLPEVKPQHERNMRPAAARLRRLGYELACPCAGVVDGLAVTILATLDRMVVVEDAAGTRMLARLASVYVSSPRWRSVRPDAISVASHRGRQRARESKLLS